VPEDTGQAAKLVRLVRACFQHLKNLAGSVRAGTGVTESARGVLEHLDVRGASTVPAIARERAVTRQNIQVVVDGLIASGLAAAEGNPAHKRSPIIALTERGRETLGELISRERSVLKALAGDLSGTDVAAAVETLSALRRALDRLTTERRAKKD
jgi:DNA-binding MarR family transcriptional regulator